jgi:transketolase
MADTKLDLASINAIRILSIDGVERANSGHPGLPMGAAPMAYVLWQRHLKHNPRDPSWADRDRFVLSGGHGSMLLYSLLHLTGYELSLDDLKAFRQLGSKTPGHPEAFVTSGVEATTGPLGQGAANAVGMAIAERALAGRFNRPGYLIVDHMTYALVSDGDLMEGVSAEAASLAGHLKLGKLVYLYDSNDICLDGPTSATFTEDVAQRYRAYGWQVLQVDDGDTDLAAIDQALAEARGDTARPSLIIVRTTIGYGSPNKQGTSKVHGAPLGSEEVALTKKNLGIESDEPFFVPPAVRDHMGAAAARGQQQQTGWQTLFGTYAAEYPELAAEWRQRFSGELPAGWDAELPVWTAGSSEATRVAAGKAQNAIAAAVPWLLGGDADLSCSTMTALVGQGSFDGQTGQGRNLHFGVREHAMGAIANGIDYHGGMRPFVSTFFCFSDYMRPSVRVAALNHQPVIYVWTHDSVALGEDGPTHQPVEHLMALRAMPNLYVVRPSDANEAAEAWRFAMQRTAGPTALVLTRQKLPVIDRSQYAAAGELAKGAYVLADAPDARAVIIASGSEVHLALAAHQRLIADGVPCRVVAMPCWEAFAAQPAEYREQVLPSALRARVSVEAGTTFGWREWIGDRGIAVGIDRFGLSAPGDIALETLGITVDNIVRSVRTVLDRAAGH